MNTVAVTVIPTVTVTPTPAPIPVPTPTWSLANLKPCKGWRESLGNELWNSSKELARKFNKIWVRGFGRHPNTCLSAYYPPSAGQICTRLGATSMRAADLWV